jgi:hypothetical protein
MPSVFLEQARQFVFDAETSVKGLLLQVAEQGDYDSLERVTSVAKELKRIRTEMESALPRVAPATPKQEATANPPVTYPRFFKTEGDKLKMIGWSDKNGEYTHEAPKDVLNILVDTLIQAGALEEPIPIGEILPQLVHPETGHEFPEYHSRTFLRWLRTIGVVKREGHKGYYFAARIGDDPWPTIEAKWNELPGLG